jgi:hypothetical protein
MSSPTIRLMAGWREAMVEHLNSCTRSHPAVGMTHEELERIRQVLGTISYRDWKVISFIDGKGVGRMQIYALIPDSTTGEPVENYSIPLNLCPGMSDGLIIDLVFELIKEYEIHEAAERFSIGGARVYYPHKPDGVPLFEVPSMRAAPSIPTAAPVEDGGAK